MKRIICLMLSIVIVLSAVPAMAADNTLKLTGEGIFIDNDTESTVWADQNGGAVISDHHIQFVTASGIMRSYGTLKAVEDALPDVFFRVNNQTIVNLRFVTHVGSNDTTVAGRTFPISRGRRREFLSALHLAGMAE